MSYSKEQFTTANFTIVYHPPHHYSGMPDRDSHLNTPYIPSDFEQRISDAVKYIFSCGKEDS
jgi:hypothetical protein